MRRALRAPAARHRPRALARDRARGSRGGCEGIKPGWVRVNFNYFIDDETFDYIVDAVRLIAAEGAALLPSYPSSR